ncbi:hypothetical protein [Pilimelia columellifera]
MTKIRTLVAALSAAALGVVAMPTPLSADAAGGLVLFSPTPPPVTGVVTNEFAFWNPRLGASRISGDWTMNSGSVFSATTPLGYSYYSGNIDDNNPDALSRGGTHSAIFRMTSRRDDFRDVTVNMALSIAGFGATESTPAKTWDGVHLWLRYQNDRHTYYASLARRDGRVVIKKKCPGGWVNGGSYHELSEEVDGFPMRRNLWKDFSVTTRNNPDGSVAIQIKREGDVVVSAVDHGVGCAPITQPGALGLRGDNSRFYFRDFEVRTAAAIG